MPVAPVTVSIIIIAVRPTNISMITVAMMLISSTVIIMARYMDIIGLSFSIQLSLIIDWERSRLSRGAWLLVYTPNGNRAVTHDLTAHTNNLTSSYRRPVTVKYKIFG